MHGNGGVLSAQATDAGVNKATRELFRLADRARCLQNPDLAADRMRRLLAVHGVG